MDELQIFHHEQFGSVRAMLIGNEPFFVGKDAAAILGYKNSRDALGRHVAAEDKRAVAICDAIGRRQMTTIINESGLYSLILSSKLPAAWRFKHWITAEVLPAIRKHGVYAPDEVLRDPELLISALLALKKERAISKSLRETVDTQMELLTAMEPKADYYDRVLACPEAVPITVIAKDYGWSARKMNRFLQDSGVQFKIGKTWVLYAAFADKGYTKSETILYTDQCGTTHPYWFTKWTQKGRLMIYELMNQAGYRPTEAQEENHGITG